MVNRIAGFYRLPQANASRVRTLPRIREVLDTISHIPELAEMIELENNPQTWLAKLLAAHQALLRPPRAPHKPKGCDAAADSRGEPGRGRGAGTS